jgi:hypothetical protein
MKEGSKYQPLLEYLRESDRVHPKFARTQFKQACQPYTIILSENTFALIGMYPSDQSEVTLTFAEI